MSFAIPSTQIALDPPWLSDPLWQGAQAVPSLDLHFADRSLVDSVSGQNLVTFTRASSATYVDSTGTLRTAATNEPRFDHNPTTRESLGLLVEEQRTNLLLRSEEFDNATGWSTGASSVTANATIAPNGTSTAGKLVENTANDFHAISQYVLGFSLGAVVTLSIFAKESGRSKFRLQTDSTGGSGTVDFDLSAGTATAGTGVFSSGSIINAGNGWYRCSVSCTTSAAGAIGLKLILAQTTYGAAYTGNGTSGVFFWGAQLEAGAFPTSYIPTTTATVTRAADMASITGSNFSSFYNQTEGTVFTEGSILNTISNKTIAALNNGTINEEIILYWNNGFASLVTDNGIFQGNSFGGSVTVNSRTLHAIRYKLNDMQGYGNGAALSAITSATVPTINRMNIGRRDDNSFWFNGPIRRLAYFPASLPLPTLQRITQQ